MKTKLYLSFSRYPIVKTAMLILVIFMLPAKIWGQPQYTTTFTTAGSPSAIPFYSNTNNKAQWLFYHNDFPSAPSGYINKIYFRNDIIMLPVLCNFTDFQIKMGQSTLTTLIPGPWITSGMNTAFSANNFQVAPIASNWIPVVLQTPFYYDNTMNFIVEASHTNYTVGFMLMQASMNSRSLFGNVTSLLANSQNYLCDFGFDMTIGSADVKLMSVNLADSICSGSLPVTIMLKNNGPSTLTSTNISWKINNVAQPPVNWTGNLAPGLTSLFNLGSYNFSPSTLYNFIASSYQPNNLPDPDTSNDTLIKNNIWVYPKPAATPFSTSYSICQGDSLDVVFNLSGTPPWHISYSIGSVPYTVQQSTSPLTVVVHPYLATPLSVSITSLTDATGCTGSSLPQVTIQVKPMPSVSLGPDKAVKASQNVTLDAGAGFAHYLWSTGDTTQTVSIPGQSLGAGTHPVWVIVTNTAGCSSADTISITIIDDIGTDTAPGQLLQVRIIPNPSCGLPKIEVDNPGSEGIIFEISGSDGKTICITSAEYTGSTLHIETPCSLSPGIYTLKLTSGNQVLFKKFIIASH
jgi:hypothetical protein